MRPAALCSDAPPILAPIAPSSARQITATIATAHGRAPLGAAMAAMSGRPPPTVNEAADEVAACNGRAAAAGVIKFVPRVSAECVVLGKLFRDLGGQSVIEPAPLVNTGELDQLTGRVSRELPLLGGNVG